MRIFCIADIHIDDYRYYNPSREDYMNLNLTGEIDDYRLLQCLTFAQALVKYGVKSGVDTLFVLGDIINKPKLSPRIFHVCREFFDTLSNQFNIYYILGQHDMDSKVETLNIRDTFISEFNGPKIHYMHDQITTIDGRVFKFKNWQPLEEVDFGSCDVALGHVSLGICQRPLGDYKLGVFGDIHSPVQFDHIYEDKVVGTDYSVSTPYQHYPAQHEVGMFGVIDTLDLSYSRVESDSILM